MAVDKYIDSNIVGAFVTKLLSKIVGGSTLQAHYATFSINSADGNGSVYRVFKDVDPNFIPLYIGIGCDALTTGTDHRVGVYRPRLGAALAAAVYATGLTFASAVASLNPKTALDGMKDLGVINWGKRLFEQAGHTVVNKLDSYDIAITANTASTVTGNVAVLMFGIQG